MSDRLVHAGVCLIRAKTELAKMLLSPKTSDDILLPFFDSMRHTRCVGRELNILNRESGEVSQVQSRPRECMRRVQIRVPLGNWEGRSE